MFQFELGEEVKEKVTGFQGIVMARTEHITGCKQYGILPRTLDKDGKPQDWQWYDEERLSLVGPGVVIKETVGGPQPVAPSR